MINRLPVFVGNVRMWYTILEGSRQGHRVGGFTNVPGAADYPQLFAPHKWLSLLFALSIQPVYSDSLTNAISRLKGMTLFVWVYTFCTVSHDTAGRTNTPQSLTTSRVVRKYHKNSRNVFLSGSWGWCTITHHNPNVCPFNMP